MTTTNENYQRRRKLKIKSSKFIIIGFIVSQNFVFSERYQPQGLLHWMILLAGSIFISYGFASYLPIWKEEKREKDEWRREEKAELDAANVFLFGTSEKGN